MAKGAEYFTTLTDTVKDLTILWWAKVISWGNWGAMTERGPEKIAGNSKYKEKRAFVKRAIQRAFSSGSYYCFPLPPSCSVGSSRTQSTKLYGWANAIYRGYGPLPPSYETPTGEFCEPPSGTYYSDHNSGPETPTQLRMVDNRSPSGPFSHMPDPFRETSAYTNLGEGIYAAPDPRTVTATGFDFSNESNPWANESSNKGKKRSYKEAVASRPTSPSSATTSRNTQVAKAKYSPSTNPTSWIVRFPTAIPNDQRYPKSIIVEMVNSLPMENKKQFNFTCIAARWTHAGNIALTFDARSKSKDIEAAQLSILSKANHTRADATIKQNVPWSVIIAVNVPCRRIELTPEGIALQSPNPNEALWTPAQIIEQVKRNQSLAHASFPKPPNWTKSTETDRMKITKGSLFIYIEDADGSLAKEVTARGLYLWSSHCPARSYKEKVDLTYCDRCWNFGKQHDRCHSICRLCASTEHVEKDHLAACMACHAAHSVEILKEAAFTCPHKRCKHWSSPHPANDESCKGREVETKRIRDKKGNNKLPPNQPVLDTSLYSKPSRQQAPTQGGTPAPFQTPAPRRPVDNTPESQPGWNVINPGHGNRRANPAARPASPRAPSRQQLHGNPQSANRFHIPGDPKW